MGRLDYPCAYFPCNQLPVCACNLYSFELFAGIGCASANGVLVKGSNYLEALSDTQYIVFDKTGTLTKGVFEVTGIYPANGFDENTIVGLASYAESASNHPISISLKSILAKKLSVTAYLILKKLPVTVYLLLLTDIKFMPVILNLCIKKILQLTLNITMELWFMFPVTAYMPVAL